jgi:error-prone DNA polymerase
VAEGAAALGLGTVAVADRGGVYGIPRFHKAAQAAGVAAIVGAEAVLPDGARLPLLVQSARGWSNLCRLLTDGALGETAWPVVGGRWPEETHDEEEETPTGHRPLAPGHASHLSDHRSPTTGHASRLAGHRPPATPLISPATGHRPPATPLISPATGHRPPATPHLKKGEGRVSWELVEEHAAGLVALTGGAGGPLVRALEEGGEEAAAAVLRRLAGIFGPERVAVEVQRHQRRGEEARNAALVRLAHAVGVRVVATQDALVAKTEDGPLADVLACIREHRTLDAAGRLLEPNRARRLRSPDEMARLFADLPEAIANTSLVAEACPFRLHQLPYRFPSARLAAGRDEAEELAARVAEGARERYREVTPKVRAQLERELALIAKLGLSGYFLVVHDIVRFCRARGILAQGRGSAANSAVCYALAITAVDPVAMELLFERFLSEERGEWPDIDIDLPSGDLREEVIQHVYRTYGARGAAMTANVISYKRRSATREVGKVLGFSAEHLGRLAALSGSWEFAAHVREELPEHLRIAGLAPEERRSRLLVELVARIMHLPRHLGQHSGGMVLAAGRLDDVVPLEPAAMPGRVVIQWDKDDCADLGIIKVDLLGLGMLQALQDAVPLIRAHEGVEVDYAHLPPDDPKVYGMLARADTVGVFQIESRAQMATLPRMRPERFYDLVVEVAIIRPGPIVGKLVHPYLNRRQGREAVVYPHPDLEPVLARTLGVPLFQEQLMKVAMVAAGFTGGQAEELRRAMGAKRSIERMAKLETQLRDGMAARGITGKAADEIVQGITSFALYGFPESHAASFALIAYASAYLKAHHPEAFLCALLNAWPMGFYHPATLIQDARRHGVRVLPIDVNRSGVACRIEERGRWPVAGGRGSEQRGRWPVAGGRGSEQRGRWPVAGGRGSEQRGRWPVAGGWEDEQREFEGEQAVGRAGETDHRQLATDYASSSSGSWAPVTGHASASSTGPRPPAPDHALSVRLGLRFVKGLRAEAAARIEAEAARAPFSAVREVAARCALRNDELAALAEVGAFATLGATRRSALWQVSALDGRRPALAQAMQPDPGASPLPEMTLPERYVADYRGAGMTLGRHPLAMRRGELAARGVLCAAELARARDGALVRVGGAVIVRQRPYTAGGMCFMTLEDETGFANIAVTPVAFELQRAVITGSALLEVEGRAQARDGVVTVLAGRCSPLFAEAPVPPSRDFH